MKHKINWEKIWEANNRWSRRRFRLGHPWEWKETQKNIQRLVEKQLAEKEKRKS